MIDKNREIEEMAKAVCHLDRTCDECMTSFECKAMMYAKRFYEAGYRKQREGEWKKAYNKSPKYVCTACNHLFNNKEYKFCPFCGAQMKGESK